jgi:hypothetical protein
VVRPSQQSGGIPIIFIHYGPASYLSRTLRCARRTNPDKRIILLGDESNRRSTEGAAEYFPFEDFSSGAKHARFQQVFQAIQGERHRFSKHGGMEAWLKFVFRRWFLIEGFLAHENIDSFWTFDSDTIVLAPLAARESRFRDIEATTQCRGECLNGWVGSFRLVERYTACILDLFSDPLFLDAQRERLRAQAGLAFNEMDAFGEFRRRTGARTMRASSVIQGEAFDDALAFVDGYEPSRVSVQGRTAVKSLWTSPQGGIWAKLDGEYVGLATCNMSWMPDYLWRRVLNTVKADSPVFASKRVDPGVLREVNLREPFWEYCSRWLRGKIWRLRRLFAFR